MRLHAGFAATMLGEILARLFQAKLVGPAGVCGVAQLYAVVFPKTDGANVEGVIRWSPQSVEATTWAGVVSVAVWGHSPKEQSNMFTKTVVWEFVTLLKRTFMSSDDWQAFTC